MSQGPFYTFWSTRGIMYSVQRDNMQIHEYKGLPNSDTKGKYVGFPADYDVTIDDILIPITNEKFYVTDTIVDYWDGEPSQKKAYIQTEAEHRTSRPQQTTVFNIGTANSSIIGNQANATLNYASTIQTAKEQLASTNSPDKEELQQIISLLEMVVNNQVPPQKGLFSKFSAVMERNSWITGTISSALLSWLMTQIPV